MQLLAKSKKILYMGFRATLNFRKEKKRKEEKKRREENMCVISRFIVCSLAHKFLSMPSE